MTTQLLGLRAANYKRIELVDIEFPPEGGVVAIMGANEAGKTSALDALEATIAGRKATKSVKPIRDGADEARIIATFDDIIVTRVYKANGTTQITVTGADGRRVDRAEDLLNSLYSHVALDPLAFSRLSDKEQIDTLLPLIGFDPAPLDAARKETYDLRTIKNREVDRLAAVVESFPDDPLNLPAEEISVADLSNELAEAVRVQAGREQLAREADEIEQTKIPRSDAEIARLEEALAQARHYRSVLQSDLDANTEALKSMPSVDVEALRARVESAESTNTAIRQRAAREESRKALAAARAESEELTAKLATLEADKKRALAEANMPVPNLSIDGDPATLTLAGIPFSQASTGVKIRTGTAIAMALNPDLRLIVIRDASLLDAGNREVIDELAKENGFLVLMEIADENAPVGVVIDDGRVREVRGATEWEQ